MSAKHEIVSGVKYYLTLNLDGVECEITIIYRDWLNQYSNASSTCPISHNVYGRRGVDVYDPITINVARATIDSIFRFKNQRAKYYFLSSAQKQEVPVKKYYLNFKLIDIYIDAKDECSAEVWYEYNKERISTTCNDGSILTVTHAPSDNMIRVKGTAAIANQIL